jgi:phosphate transport system substrate-binding protein
MNVVPPRNARPKNMALALLFFGTLLLVALPASSQEGVVQRDRLHIVSSASSVAVTEALVSAFVGRYALVRQPRTDVLSAAAALDRFCAGAGVNTPDIAISGRRMPRSVFAACQSNGVTDVVEVQLGLGAVVLAMRRGDTVANLTTRQVYAALAADYAVEDDFQPNSLNTWSQLSNGLPATPIRAFVPDRHSGTRSLFNDFVMEGGCREMRAVQQIFASSSRVARCTTLRDDRRVAELASAAVPAALLTSPPGTIAAISYAQLLESGGNLVPVALNGVLPSAASIASGEYDLTRTIYLYAKRQHARTLAGVGVVRGIGEFTNDAVSEAVGGPGGLLTQEGLVPLVPAARAAQRQIAQRQTLLSR